MKRLVCIAKKYGLLYLALFIYSVSSVFAKYAAMQSRISGVILFFVFEGIFLAIYAVLWQQVLKKLSLVSAMANKGIVVVFNMIWAVLIFSEKITLFNVIGAATIIFGICVVATSD